MRTDRTAGLAATLVTVTAVGFGLALGALAPQPLFAGPEPTANLSNMTTPATNAAVAPDGHGTRFGPG